ncbi:small-subunit processome, partial [Tribonema minus]
MSSLRNAVKRKTHKERAQPASRSKFGLLEKHSDYVLRARDYNAKRDRLNALRLKASLRNPDEFYFGMHKAKTKEGVHQVEGSSSLDHETAHMLKTQDMAYIHMKRAVDIKKAERLKAGLHMLDAPPQNTHTVFVKNKRQRRAFDAAEYFDTAPELAGRTFNRPRMATLESKQVLGAESRADLKKALKQRDAAYQEVEAREERARKMTRAAAHLAAQRALMTARGTVTKVKGAEKGQPPVYKWKRQRAK